MSAHDALLLQPDLTLTLGQRDTPAPGAGEALVRLVIAERRLARALALKVAREFDPEFVIGVANAGVVPGAVVAAILDRPFHSMMVSRRYRADTVRATPSSKLTAGGTLTVTVGAVDVVAGAYAASIDPTTLNLNATGNLSMTGGSATGAYEFQNVVVNLAGTMGTRYLKTTFLVTGVNGADVKPAFESLKPRLTDGTLNVLSLLPQGRTTTGSVGTT